MKLKKVLAVLCVCALAFSLTVPAFAGPNPTPTPTAVPIDNEASINLGGTFPDSDLTVAVSVLYAMRKLYVNPYGLPYNISNTTLQDGSEIYEETVSAGWFSNTAVIKNNSTSELPVKVTITTTPGEDSTGTVKVVPYTVGTATDPAIDPDGATINPNFNCLYGAFQIADAEDEDGVITPDWSADGNLAQVAIPDSDNQIYTPQNANFSVVAAEEGQGEFAGTTIPGYAAFRVRGGAATKTAGVSGGDLDSIWPETEVIDMTIAFTFG